MKHLGDITQIHGDEIEPVDVITGGSPCQDLSIAGKRAGLAGKRSGLFMEQIRIIREMRNADVLRGRTGQFVRPRFMVWENVAGAFSSNGGKDFEAVLEETIHIVEPNAPAVPVPDGGWPWSGCLYDEMGRWSLAWRLHDAQFWGVPQRRARISLVADFGGLAAPEVSFERKGVCWRSEESAEAEKETAGGAENGAMGAGVHGASEQSRRTGQGAAAGADAVLQGEDTLSFVERAGKDGGGKGILIQRERTGAINSSQPVYCLQGNGIDRADTAGCNGKGWKEDVSYTLNTIDRPSVAVTVVCQEETGAKTTYYSKQKIGEYKESKQASTCAARDFKDATDLIVSDRIVRRLTPLEYDRLQGYPDNWTDIGDWMDAKGKTHKTSDSNRYKADGNSIALPFWFWLLRRISALYERPATMGSLFDGIGGFPLCWERCNGKGTARWASEIDEFAIAVTKRRFGEE